LRKNKREEEVESLRKRTPRKKEKIHSRILKLKEETGPEPLQQKNIISGDGGPTMSKKKKHHGLWPIRRNIEKKKKKRNEIENIQELGGERGPNQREKGFQGKTVFKRRNVKRTF